MSNKDKYGMSHLYSRTGRRPKLTAAKSESFAHRCGVRRRKRNRNLAFGVEIGGSWCGCQWFDQFRPEKSKIICQPTFAMSNPHHNLSLNQLFDYIFQCHQADGFVERIPITVIVYTMNERHLKIFFTTTSAINHSRWLTCPLFPSLNCLNIMSKVKSSNTKWHGFW